AFQYPGLVGVEVRLTDPEEPPVAPFQVTLAGQVALVRIGSVPRVPVALDREPRPRSHHDQVDPVGTDRELWDDGVASLVQPVEHALLEQRLERGDEPVLRSGAGPGALDLDP